MRRYIPGLHSGQQDLVSNLDGLFLVRVERASYRWHPQKPFFALRFAILEPTSHEALSFSGRLYCTERALWKLRWFLQLTLATTPNCSPETRSMKRRY